MAILRGCIHELPDRRPPSPSCFYVKEISGIYFEGTTGFTPQACPEWILGVQYRRATLADAQSALAAGTDKPEIVRVKWDRHNGGANYIFFDGHAKWHRLEQTLNPNDFLWGDRWYPAAAPGQSCSGG